MAGLQLPSAALAAEGAGLSGSFSVSYAFLLGGAPLTTNDGPLLRADLMFEAEGKVATLALDPFGLRSQSASFEIRQGSELFSVGYTRTPSDGLDPGRGDTTEVQALVVARPADAPAVQALLNSQVVAGLNGSRSLVARVGLNDRYREPLTGVSSIDWRASLQINSLLVASTDLSRSAFTSSFGVGAAFGGERSRTLRPQVDVSWRSGVEETGAGQTVAQNVRLRSGLAIDATQFETVSLGADWEFDREAAWTASDSQSLSVRSTRLTPFNVAASVSRASAPVGASAYGWSLNADTKLGELFTAGLGYRGEADQNGSGHGVTGSLGARWATTSLSLRSSLEGGAMWRSDGTLLPDAAFTLAIATPTGSEVDLNLAASLKYAERLAAALNASGAADLGRVHLSFDGELSYAGALRLAAGAAAAIDVIDFGDRQLGLQLGIEARTIAGGVSAASVDLGLRYAFGDPR